MSWHFNGSKFSADGRQLEGAMWDPEYGGICQPFNLTSSHCASATKTLNITSSTEISPSLLITGIYKPIFTTKFAE
jgi:hypothetical protein